jgi:hypothetical protein
MIQRIVSVAPSFPPFWASSDKTVTIYTSLFDPVHTQEASSEQLYPEIHRSPCLGSKHLPARRALSHMQAAGDVVRLPVVQDGPLDFATFFADEHRERFRPLCFVRGAERMPRT